MIQLYHISTGFTPLHIASLNGNVNINGWTPLMPAVCSGYNDIVLDLCTANADVNVEDNFGKTALAYATMKERSNVVQVLIQFGANINHQLQPEGWTPLMLAAQNGNLEITQLLCSQPDIQLDAIDNFGYTAIDIAKSHHHNLVHEELENRTHMKIIFLGTKAILVMSSVTENGASQLHWNSQSHLTPIIILEASMVL
eukprot:Em0007g695a